MKSITGALENTNHLFCPGINAIVLDFEKYFSTCSHDIVI